MSTRGTLEINGKEYYIGSDAYPSVARRKLKQALRDNPKNPREFVRAANEAIGFKWIGPTLKRFPKFKGSIMEEYCWKVNLRKKTVNQCKRKPGVKKAGILSATRRK